MPDGMKLFLLNFIERRKSIGRMLGAILAFLILTPQIARAGSIITFGNPAGVTSLFDVINLTGDWIFTFAIVIGPILLVVAGIIFMTAGGDPGRISTARRIILWTVIGFLIILLSKGLIVVLRGLLGF